MGHIQRERLLKSSDNDKWTFEIVHVLRFRNGLNEQLCCRFIFTNLQKSLRSLGKVWLEILVANLATNFQDLVAKVKNLVALAPALGAILRPERAYYCLRFAKKICCWNCAVNVHVYGTWRFFGYMYIKNNEMKSQDISANVLQFLPYVLAIIIIPSI